VSFDLLAVVSVSVVLLISLADKRYLIIGWFLVAPYFYPLGLRGEVNIPTNLSHNLLVPFIAVVILGSTWLQGRKLALGREDLFFFIFILYIWVSSFYNSINSYDNMKTIYSIYIIPYLLFAVIRNIRIDVHWLTVLAYASIFHLVVLSLMGYYEFRTGLSLYTQVLRWHDVGMGRIAGPFISPIILGLGVSLYSLCILLAFNLQKISKLTFSLSMLLSVVLYVLTFTRSVWLGVLASLVYVILMSPTKPSVRILKLLGMAGVLVFLTLYLLSFSDVANRVLDSENVNFRIAMAYASVRMIMASPIFGWGFGAFDLVIQKFLPNLVWAHMAYDTSHVTLFTLTAELGVVGSLMLVLFVYRILSSGNVPIREMSIERQLIVVTNIGFVLAFAVNAFLIDMRFFSIAYSWFFMSLGMVRNAYLNEDMFAE
jgi:O-antigen ligase